LRNEANAGEQAAIFRHLPSGRDVTMRFHWQIFAAVLLLIATHPLPRKLSTQCRDKVIAAGDDNGGTSWSGDRGAVAAVGGPVDVPFGADDEPADLVIEADLPATDEHPLLLLKLVRKSVSD
jgi:hypothetical protein